MSAVQIAEVRSFYDGFWDPANEAAQLEHDYWTFQVEAREWAYAQLSPVRGKRILEIGPGLGQDTVTLAERGAELTVIDVSAPGLDVARRAVERAGLLDRCTFEQRDAQATGFPDDRFDGIFARGVTMHVDHHVFLREMARILKPGASVVLIDPLKYHPVINLYRLSVSSCKDSRPTYRTIRDMADAARYFSAFDHREFYLNSVLALIFRSRPGIYEKLTRPLQALDQATLAVLPFLRPFAWTVVVAYRK
ncbi:MAG TPA: class I SAM-dependent methyltransferase [Dehalococcoidia bacterium]|nr:class I SAM-dependent methyltransferase [Dehalococcoidia bacterium]